MPVVDVCFCSFFSTSTTTTTSSTSSFARAHSFAPSVQTSWRVRERELTMLPKDALVVALFRLIVSTPPPPHTHTHTRRCGKMTDIVFALFVFDLHHHLIDRLARSRSLFRFLSESARADRFFRRTYSSWPFFLPNLFNLFQLTLSLPLPPSSLRRKKKISPPPLSSLRARLPSARGQTPPQPMPSPLILPLLGASRPARTPRRCPLPRRSRSTGGLCDDDDEQQRPFFFLCCSTSCSCSLLLRAARLARLHPGGRPPLPRRLLFALPRRR